MKNKKLKQLHLKAGIHTVSIKTSNIPAMIPVYLSRCIENRNCNQSLLSKVKTYRTKINPNHFNLRSEINSLEDFNKTMAIIKRGLGISKYDLTRVDFSLDNLERGSYDKHLKINKWLILLMHMKLTSKSKYQSIDPLSLEMLTIRVVGEYYQMEYYNKKLESHGRSPVQARLELRSTRLTKTHRTVEDEIRLWCERLESLPKFITKLQENSNKFLIKRWKKETASGVVRSHSEFIRKYQDYIFTNQQLIDLCKKMGLKEKYARDLKYRQNIETYSEKELVSFINLIVEELKAFTTGSSNS